jgi:hypothetical protein
MNGNLTDMKKKMLDEINKNSSNSLKTFETNIKRIEENEKNNQKINENLKDIKLEFEEKLFIMQNNMAKEVNEIKKELSDHSIILENLENKINDNVISINRDIGELIKGVNYIKLEIESIRNFKENTVLNFKDIGDEFLRNEENTKKFNFKINQQLMEFDSKITTFEQTFNLLTDNLMNVKKDIYAQVYETNLNLNNKMQMFNDNIIQKQELNDRAFYDFENNLMVILIANSFLF